MSLDDLLDEARAVSPPAAGVLERTRAEVLGVLDASLVRRARIVRRRRHRRLALGAVAAASAAVIGVATLTTRTAPPDAGGGPGLNATPLVVTKQFRTVAQVTRAAGATGSVELGSAPYWKVVSDYHSLSCTEADCTPVDGHRTAWVGIAGRGVIEDTQFGADRPSIPLAEVTLAGQRMTWPEANRRSWTPAQVAQLAADTGGDDKPGRAPSSWYVFKNTGDLLAESPASPAIRGELWRLLGKVGGVRLVGGVTDHQGRPGWELRLSSPTYGTQSYIVDPGSGRLLESRVRLPGQVPTWTTYLSAGPAGTAPAATAR